MTIAFVQIDAFTEAPFQGNPAAVCFMDRPGEPEWMQSVASEMNLSETAFLVKRETGVYDLRWFTPASEVDLCGHATLAAAHALWDAQREDRSLRITFHTRSGVLAAELRGRRVVLDFPAEVAMPAAVPATLLKGLGLTPRFVGLNRMDYLVEVESEGVVRELRPDFRALAELGTRGVIVTSRSNHPSFDFVSRYFAPAYGINEDPVTGSAHCCLGPYWQRELGKDEFIAYQASVRGGVVGVRVRGGRVELLGHAVTVLRGELLV